MKFRNYLKAVKFYFLLEIIFALVLLISIIFSGKSVYEMYVSLGKSLAIVNHLRAASEIIGRFQYLVKFLLVSLTGFFIAKNFRLVYGKLKNML